MAGGSDMQAHERTYRRVTALMWRGAIACFFIAFFVIWLIS